MGRSALGGVPLTWDDAHAVELVDQSDEVAKERVMSSWMKRRIERSRERCGRAEGEANEREGRRFTESKNSPSDQKSTGPAYHAGAAEFSVIKSGK